LIASFMFCVWLTDHRRLKQKSAHVFVCVSFLLFSF
jgi:hypothetical protein